MSKTQPETARRGNFAPRSKLGVPRALAFVLASATGACGPSTLLPPNDGQDTVLTASPSAVTTNTAAVTAPKPAASAAPAPQGPHGTLAVAPEIKALLDAPDRLPEDRMLDAGRKPDELLTFLGVKPGMHVAELGAGGGYTSEFLARAVAPNGKVFGQNTKMLLDKFAEKPWSERLKRPVMADVVRADRDFEDPLPPDAKNLDIVLINLFYHDLYWMNVDRDKMNKAVFAALKPGGIYAIIDHAAKDGDGAKDVQTLHRIEESEVIRDVEKSGFKRFQEGDFLRNPADTKDWSTSPKVAGEKRGTSDRFALLFKKP